MIFTSFYFTGYFWAS